MLEMREKPIVLDGKALATRIEEELKPRVQAIKDRAATVPRLATILVGEDPSSKVYVSMKGRACRRVGLESELVHLPDRTTTEELLQVIQELNLRADIAGILLQHPVPRQIDERRCFDAIDLAKDVDGVTCLGFGKMSMNGQAYGSATPAGIMRLLRHYGLQIEGRRAVVVGRSPILGKPLAMMLLNENATVTICHSKTRDLPGLLRQADLVVGALGRPEFIKAEWLGDDTIVIDAGYHQGGIGDIELAGIQDRCRAYTPVPGGVGPMTIATLLAHTVDAAERQFSAQV